MFGLEDELISEIAEQKEYIQHLEAELNIFKQVVSNFTGRSKKELDNIVPEDLEYALLRYQNDIEKLYTNTLEGDEHAQHAWAEIKKLYRTLQPNPPVSLVGFSELKLIKIFIKTLAREHAANQKLTK